MINLLIKLWFVLSMTNTDLSCDSKNLHDQCDIKPSIIVFSDSTKMVQTVKQFIRWYKHNYQKMYSRPLVKKDTDGNYEVDLPECKRFLETLRSSGFISNTYCSLREQYFTDKQKNFKEFPQNEGPPEGFDFDLVLITQEPEYIWNGIDTFQYPILQLSDGKGIVGMKGGYDFDYEFELGKENGIWKIDYIATPNYD